MACNARILGLALLLLLTWARFGNMTPAQLDIPPEITAPTLAGFQPLPPADTEFSEQIAALVRETQLDEKCPAERNPDGYEEWSSICIVDLTDPQKPLVGGWEMENFVYPASMYKMYVLGEAVRQILDGEYTLDTVLTVKEHNVRGGSRPTAGQEITVSEVLRLMSQYSDNTAANEAIDLVDRRRASMLLRAMGCEGSDVTRKFLPRSSEDEGYAEVPGTLTSALHAATFLWAVESGAIGGGRGRGLIKAYMATDETNLNRLRAGLPPSATMFSKTGWWNTFTTESAIIEDGTIRYILAVMTPYPRADAEPRMAAFAEKVHQLIKQRAAKE